MRYRSLQLIFVVMCVCVYKRLHLVTTGFKWNKKHKHTTHKGEESRLTKLSPGDELKASDKLANPLGDLYSGKTFPGLNVTPSVPVFGRTASISRMARKSALECQWYKGASTVHNILGRQLQLTSMHIASSAFPSRLSWRSYWKRVITGKPKVGTPKSQPIPSSMLSITHISFFFILNSLPEFSRRFLASPHIFWVLYLLFLCKSDVIINLC